MRPAPIVLPLLVPGGMSGAHRRGRHRDHRLPGSVPRGVDGIQRRGPSDGPRRGEPSRCRRGSRQRHGGPVRADPQHRCGCVRRAHRCLGRRRAGAPGARRAASGSAGAPGHGPQTGVSRARCHPCRGRPALRRGGRAVELVYTHPLIGGHVWAVNPRVDGVTILHAFDGGTITGPGARPGRRCDPAVLGGPPRAPSRASARSRCAPQTEARARPHRQTPGLHLGAPVELAHVEGEGVHLVDAVAFRATTPLGYPVRMMEVPHVSQKWWPSWTNRQT